jgi:DNA-directed RNA polymerase I and III subunit RPAC1
MTWRCLLCARFPYLATASYRLMPEIELLEPIVGDDARRLAECFSPGVIETYEDAHDGGRLKARVKCPRNDTVSRECLRHPEFADKIRLGRTRDHFICK